MHTVHTTPHTPPTHQTPHTQPTPQQHPPPQSNLEVASTLHCRLVTVCGLPEEGMYVHVVGVDVGKTLAESLFYYFYFYCYCYYYLFV